MPGRRTFVGFGFGPIQSALFLYEAFRTGRFSRLVIAEVDETIVGAVRAAGGRYSINLALADRIERAEITGVELYQPSVPADRDRLLEALTESDEVATSLPSVAFFDNREVATSVARMLAEGWMRRRQSLPTIVYTAENHNHAAELLQAAVAGYAPAAALGQIQFLNTVIGKMSGVITDAATISRLGLAPLTPSASKAVLVEEFNKILISHIALSNFKRGIDVFLEKPDLLPFEEAKLYGHNAIHALMGYLAARRGLRVMAEVADHPDLMTIARGAFLEESGAALIRRYGHLGDPLFSSAGYAAYAEDLLARMVRPTLNDLIERVVRDPVRKLGYDDRFFGTMRLALAHDIEPRRLAEGAAAAVLYLVEHWDANAASLRLSFRPTLPLDRETMGRLLSLVWSNRSGPDADRLIGSTWDALQRLMRCRCQ